MTNLRYFCYTVLLTLGCNVSFAINTTIPSELSSKLSVNIINSSNGNAVFNYQADAPRLVASNVKLFTTLFGLENLKADFRWHTQLLYTGNITNGVLEGNVYLTGGGDPTLNDSAVYKILSQLKRMGVKEIKGNVIFDNSIFNSKPKYSMLEYTAYDSDTVVPHGLIINGNLALFTILINKQQRIELKNNLYQYKINNQIQLDPQSDAPCGEPYKSIKLKLESSSQTLTLSGSVSRSCNNKVVAYNLLSSFAYNKMVITKVMNDFGIVVNGSYQDGSTPDGAILIYEHHSANLEQVLIDMNYFSNNLISEAIILSVGAYKTKNVNTFASSSGLFSKFLDKYQLFNPKFKLENGSGLSRVEYFTAKNVGRLLYLSHKSPLSADFEATLPTPLREGTLRQSFPDLSGRLFAKTGSLNDVGAYSGYFYAKDGTKYIIVLIANDITPAQRDIFYNWVNKLLLSI